MSFGCSIWQVQCKAKACVCKWAHEGELPRDNMWKKQPGMMKCLCLHNANYVADSLAKSFRCCHFVSQLYQRAGQMSFHTLTHTHTHVPSANYIQADFTVEKFCFRVTHCYVHCAFHKRPFQNVHSRRNRSYKRSHTYKLLHTYKLCHCEAYCFMADYRFL